MGLFLNPNPSIHFSNIHINLTNKSDLIENWLGLGGINLSFCGGFIKDGVGFDAEAVKKVTIEDWLDHLDHTAELVGADQVGIGSDLDDGCGFSGLDDVTCLPSLTE
ncbi:membrane dipeptidase [Candidatus Bathyarchaeota archaeon]|nr:membrane dipeptidase [Candidatus Bathyarchaeota archaeon]